jgi:hypothetical protein
VQLHASLTSVLDGGELYMPGPLPWGKSPEDLMIRRLSGLAGIFNVVPLIQIARYEAVTGRVARKQWQSWMAITKLAKPHFMPAPSLYK